MVARRSARGLVAPCATACLIAALLAGPVATAGAAAGPQPPAAGALGRQLAPVRDTIIGPVPRSSRAFRATTSGANRYPTGDGHSVAIEVSPLILVNPDQVAQEFATFLGTRLHGSEIDLLHVYVAANQTDVATYCGPGALACYSPSDETMFAERPSDQQPSPDDPNSKFVITHEYGHHVANHLNNAPWDALDRGAKRWGSHQRICPGVRSGKYYPGDENLHYEDNPGEGWAEAYAFRRYPNQIPWNLYNPDLAPDQRAFDEIWRDVKKPWTGRTRRIWRNRFGPGDPRNKRRRFVSPLDGSARISLTMPDTADYDLRILATGSSKVLATGINVSPSHEIAYYNVCGRRTFRVQVHRYFGNGSFQVRVLRP